MKRIILPVALLFAVGFTSAQELNVVKLLKEEVQFLGSQLDPPEDVRPADTVEELEKQIRSLRRKLNQQKLTQILPYRTNYFMTSWDPEKKEDRQQKEVIFQVSGKLRIFHNLLEDFFGFYVFFTQRSWWQLFDVDGSAQTSGSNPFRESNYNIGGWWEVPPIPKPSRFFFKALRAGYEHESNGQSPENSRSWDRLFLVVRGEHKTLTAELKTWRRIPEGKERIHPLDPKGNDNPHTDEIYGNHELRVNYEFGPERLFHLGLIERNNLRPGDENKGGLTVEMSWNTPWNFLIYTQYFNGFGESMADYDRHMNRYALGMAKNRWNW